MKTYNARLKAEIKNQIVPINYATLNISEQLAKKLKNLHEFYEKKKDDNYYHHQEWFTLIDELFNIMVIKMGYECTKITHYRNAFFTLNGNINSTLQNMEKISQENQKMMINYIDIILDDNYVFKNDDHNEAQIYFFKLYIHVFAKWVNMKQWLISEYISELNMIINKHGGIQFNHQFFHNNDRCIIFADYRPILNKHDNGTHELINFMKEHQLINGYDKHLPLSIKLENLLKLFYIKESKGIHKQKFGNVRNKFIANLLNELKETCNDVGNYSNTIYSAFVNTYFDNKYTSYENELDKRKGNFTEANNLSPNTKKIVNEYIDIILNKKYKIHQNDSDGRRELYNTLHKNNVLIY